MILDEAIETTVKRINNNNVQLLCRVKNLKNVMKFCRFERIDDDGFGLNLEDGLASGKYRYFGQGFEKGECGLEISNLNLIDKTQWNCIVGLMDSADAMNNKIAESDKKVHKLSSIIDASDDWEKLKSKNAFVKWKSVFIGVFYPQLLTPNLKFISLTTKPQSFNAIQTIPSIVVGSSTQFIDFSGLPTKKPKLLTIITNISAMDFNWDIVESKLKVFTSLMLESGNVAWDNRSH